MTSEPRRFGEYLLLAPLGEGGVGRLDLSRPPGGLDAPPIVVLKRLREAQLATDEAVRRLRHEAEIAVSVESEHVVRVFDVGSVAGTPYLAMEHILGLTLAELLTSGSSLPDQVVARIFCDALDGLSALHSAQHPATRIPLGAVHRDLSPHNLMIAEEGRAVVIDLGLGRSNIQTWQTGTGVVMGTPGYMAPEQARGERVDDRSDVYAVGLLLFEALALRPYVPKGDMQTMLGAMLQPQPFAPGRSRIAPALEQVLTRALAVRPEDRFPSAAEFRAALVLASPPASRDQVVRAIPAALRARIEERRELLRRILDPAAASDDAAPTVVFARRQTITKLSVSPLATTVRIARRRLAPILLVIGVGLMIGFAATRRRSERLESEERAPAVQVVPRLIPRAEQTTAPITLPPAEVGSPAAASRKRAFKAPAAQPERTPPRVMLEHLLGRCDQLRRRRPDLAAEIDTLVTDASLWRRTPDEERLAKALPGLVERVEMLEAK